MPAKITEVPFWERVDRTPESCWEYRGPLDRHGYGRAGNQFAHRVAWALANGPLSPEVCVLHHCDNPSCVRPSHLFLGSRHDNIVDRESKGRGNCGRGERHGSAKLTEAAVREIRLSALSHREEADHWGVHWHTIYMIRTNRLWRDCAKQ